MSHLDDDQLLALARRVGRPQPSLLDTKRLARRVDEAIALEQENSRRRVSPAAAVLAMVVAGSASASAAWLWPKAAPAPAPVPVVAAPVVAAPVVAAPVVAAPVVVAPVVAVPVVAVPVVAALPAPVRVMALPSKPKPPALTWQMRAEELVNHNDLRAAANIYAAAVIDSDDPRGAALSLRGLAAREPSSIDALDAVVDSISDDDVLARVLRLRCELRLRHSRDVGAVNACRAFGQRFPADPAARPLAFGAAGLAEELGDLRLAVDEYSRTIVLAPLLKASSNEALLGRARVRTRLGELDEARADLRVYLQQEHRPGATHSDEVQGLARALRIELP